jgi:PHP family Zn ribbon phosphoesterase
VIRELCKLQREIAHLLLAFDGGVVVVSAQNGGEFGEKGDEVGGQLEGLVN